VRCESGNRLRHLTHQLFVVLLLAALLIDREKVISSPAVRPDEALKRGEEP